jgi:hypothetical protein
MNSILVSITTQFCCAPRSSHRQYLGQWVGLCSSETLLKKVLHQLWPVELFAKPGPWPVVQMNLVGEDRSGFLAMHFYLHFT